MPAPPERLRLSPGDAARSVARDLVRFVRALEVSAGLDALSGLQRAQLDAVRRALVKIAAHTTTPQTALGEEVSRVKAFLLSAREEILSKLSSPQRVSVMQAQLVVEVGDRELHAMLAPPRPSRAARPQPLSPVRRRAARERGDARRRAHESRTLPVAAGLAEHFARLPLPWRRAIWKAAGFVGRPQADYMAGYLANPGPLSALVASLHPHERQALRMVLRTGGVILARSIEERFGDSSRDAWDWDREPPTSVLGRLRLAGLVTVGRMGVPGNAHRRPRVVLCPFDLRQPLAQVLAEPGLDLPPDTAPIDGDTVENATRDDVERPIEVPFDHAQPELHEMAAALEPRLSRRVKPGALMVLVASVARAFAYTYPRHVRRAREKDLEVARRAALEDLSAVETTHTRLLQRRVVRMLSVQPHLYAYLANVLEVSTWPESDKLLVYHACDVTLRSFQRMVNEDWTPPEPG